MAAKDLELVLYQRAVEGVPERIVHKGKDVGMRLKRSDAVRGNDWPLGAQPVTQGEVAPFPSGPHLRKLLLSRWKRIPE